MKIDSAKMAALGAAAGVLLVLLFSAVPAAAESEVATHQKGLPSHGVENGYISEADDNMVQAAAEERAAPRTKRQSSTGVAHGRSSSGLSMLSGSGLKHLTGAFLVAALLSTLLSGGSSPKVPRAEDGELRATKASVAGLPSSVLPNKLLVGLAALLLVASTLARPQLHDFRPQVTLEKDSQGNEVVVIGKKWTTFEGLPKKGSKSVSLEFEGQKYRLHMSTWMEFLLNGWALTTDGVKTMLEEPRYSEDENGGHWEWGKHEDTILFHSDTKGNPTHDFYLDERSYDSLPQYTEGRTDLKYLLDIFVRETRKRAQGETTTAATTTTTAEQEIGAPVTKNTFMGRTKWIVGKGWDGKDGSYTVFYPIDSKKSLQVVLTKQIQGVLGGSVAYMDVVFAEGLDRVKAGEDFGEVPADFAVPLKNGGGLDDLHLLIRSASKVVRENA